MIQLLLVEVIVACVVYLYFKEWQWKIATWLFKMKHKDEWEK